MFHGWLDRASLDQRYAEAHIVLLPSASEGFPKVIAEGMAYGAVPVVSDVSSVAMELATARCGIALPTNDVAAFAAAIADLIRSGRWKEQSEAAVLGARRYTYGPYVEAVGALFRTSDSP
jgi:glycosyltransferase involved in cell wall biosynthesis